MPATTMTRDADVTARERTPSGRDDVAVASGHPGRRGLLIDGTIAVVLFVVTVLGVISVVRIAGPGVSWPGGMPVAIAAAAGLSLPLAFRRVAPITMLALATASFAVFRYLEIPEGSMTSLAIFLVLHSAGAECPPERNRWPRAIAVAAMTVLVVYSLAITPEALAAEGLEVATIDLVLYNVFNVAFNLVFFAAAWVTGDLTWRRREAERRLQQRADQLAASRQALARRAVQDERVRIARELHDVVAHHVSVMGIQAGAARRALERDPQQASDPLSGVEQSSREAVAELQRLLGFLRDDDDTQARLPQPHLDDLDRMLDGVREAGLEVDLQIEGHQRPLLDSVELSAFRIVQEALTNALKHADGATRATVRLRYEPHQLQLTVRDDGTAAVRLDQRGDGGRGLVGMRERATLHGGQLTATAPPGGGVVIEAILPVGEGLHR